ncbi:UDP-glucose:glycoprotein glucosyltransferase 1-like isoform X2 [Anneissia japonica]|uniref:UDP-glucose:glycoprotein glucosyltransferase 1-like isoform X2 n=1 Tax=Anneissia japonica TaxID=1529436 RepID=UPI001425AFA7|nr:UDP-glucose:glycoprotein glucosyltransferase 1-like isoform X2 [Anneissia japonica]
MELVVILALAGFLMTSARAVPSQSIMASLDAKWPATPVLLETSEFLASHSNDAFWTFFESIVGMSQSQIGDEHDEMRYELGLKFAGSGLSQSELALLKLSLSLHSFSPKIALHNQMATEVVGDLECSVFVEVHGDITCSLDKIDSLVQTADQRETSIVYEIDHVYPASTSKNITVILYAELADFRSNLNKFHKKLADMAKNHQINYLFRHYVKNISKRKERLSGYGVELAIKSTEYKAYDDSTVKDGSKQGNQDSEHIPDEVNGFIFSKLRELHPDLSSNLQQFQSHLVDESNKMRPLKVWQLQDISYQAAQRVMTSDVGDALMVMRDLSQNFPMRAHSLVKTTLKDDFKKEVGTNQRVLYSSVGLESGEDMLMINGLVIDMDVADPFMLLDLLTTEAGVMAGLHALDVKGTNIDKLLRTQLVVNEGDFAVDIRDNAVVFVNDLEEDDRYRNWPSAMHEMLRPTFPGMMRHVRRNFFNLVFILDPVKPESGMLLQQLEIFFANDAPIRYGLVFVTDSDEVDGKDDAGVAIHRVLNFVLAEDGPDKALDILARIYQLADESELELTHVEQTFETFYKHQDFESIIASNSEYSEAGRGGKAFFERTALESLPQVLLNGKPLPVDQLGPDQFEETVVSAVLTGTPDIQRAIYRARLTDRMDPVEYLMDQPHVMPRLNSRILDPDVKFIQFTSRVEGLSLQDDLSSLSAPQVATVVADNMIYFTKKDDNSLRQVTMWIVADLHKEQGRQLLENAFKYLKMSNAVRIGVIYNPSTSSDSLLWLPKAIYAALQSQSKNHAKLFIQKLVKKENFDSIAAGSKQVDELYVNGMDMELFGQYFNKDLSAVFSAYRLFAEKTLSIAGGQAAVVCNGRVFGPLRDDEDLVTEDFQLIEKLVASSSANSVKDKMKLLEDVENKSDLTMKVDALLAANPQADMRRDVPRWKSEHSILEIEAREANIPSYEITAVLDPLSRNCQKWSHILYVLTQVLNVRLKLFLNPREKLSEMPIKSFYRYVFEPELTFQVDSSLSTGPSAKFTDMPLDVLLTMNLITPESWLVEAVNTPYDLDNIKLSEVDSSVYGKYELEYLLLEGHCYDQNSGQPPRGLQFTLGTKSQPVIVDTIVMANLGYFQLKANPGAWILRLREGRSSDIYQVSSVQGADSRSINNDVIVIMDSFKSNILKIRVSKKPDKLNEDILAEESDDSNEGGGGIWDSISSIAGGGRKTTVTEADKDTTLNIFSLASGHLYERFLRIMMLSVLKNTKSKVKFWFLKNFLSPTLKDFLPHMADKYGFEYELVQYKWPRWLHQQTEKQRIIWGYKILFLDVLFPLHVKKIIFVDADQIVRADLQDLADLDLKGAPYGYTPFCDSRTDMDGFRFWKSGYWASHLAGRKYHISALYVVDLVKFRKIAAGDRLRGQYQGLSQDPNSLSNLDQDLPNNMIHQVAIFSLPQEWMWCETWCSDKEKLKAKTIDLCNNPLTKEPKLESAKRIVAEWPDYDNEIYNLQQEIREKNQSSQQEKHQESHQENQEKQNKHGHGEL